MSPEGPAWLPAAVEAVLMRSSATGATVKVLPEFVDDYLKAGWSFIAIDAKEERAMTEREELFQIIWDGAVDDRVKDGKSTEENPVVRPKVWALTHAILAAGYAKHRTVTTATELDALRRFTVIRSAEGVVYEKQTMWHEAGSRDLVYWPAIALPVVVLQEGWGEE